MKKILKHIKHFEHEKKETKNISPDNRDTTKQIIAFKDQEIDKIRQNGCLFTDDCLKPSINFIVDDPASSYTKTLYSHFSCKNRFDFKELETRIKWERCQVN